MWRKFSWIKKIIEFVSYNSNTPIHAEGLCQDF